MTTMATMSSKQQSVADFTILKAERYFKWKRYQHSNSDLLLRWAEKKGITGSSEEFVLAEAFSRICLEKVMKQWYPECEVKQMGLFDHYDAFVSSPASVVEGKFRMVDDDEYPTDDITMKKADYVAMCDSGYPAYVVNIFWNGVARVYNIGDWSNTGQWTHSSTTAVDGAQKTEMRLQYDPKDAVFTTTITLPNWDEYDEQGYS